MKKLLLFALLTLSAGLAQAECVFTYTATEKLTDKFNSLGTPASHEFNNGAGTVTFSTDVTTIKEHAFVGCTALQSITLPISVTTIGEWAFTGCEALQSITLPISVTTIGNHAFYHCDALQSVNLSGVTMIGENAFLNCEALQSVDLSNVTVIEANTFTNCTALQSVTLSENVTTIGGEAFWGCKLQSITLPASVTTIGEQAFYNCQFLTEVTVAWTDATKIPAITNNVFGRIADDQGPSGATLHVPAGTQALYEAKDVWKTFGIIDDPSVTLSDYQAAAIAEINAAIEGVTYTDIIAIADKAKTDINAATTKADVTTIKKKALADIDFAIALAKAKADAVAAIDAAINGVTDENIIAIADKAKTDINAATTKADITSIKDKALADIDFAKYKADAVAEINAAIEGVTDEGILAIATTAKTNISTATTKEGVDAIKAQALADIDFAIALAKAKADAVAEIDAAVEGVTDEGILAIATTAKTNISTATTKADITSIKDKALADIDIAKYKADAVAEIQTAGQGIQNTNLNNWINGAIADINAAGTNTKEKVDNIKNQIIPMIQLFQDGKAEGIEEGDAAGYERAKAELPTDPEGTTGHTVTITKGDKTLILVNPDKVTYGKQE